MSKYNIKPNVLVVEDDDAIITLLSYTLEKAGYNVIVTNDGEEAAYVAEEQKPDIILLDWMLPGLTGIQLCERFRKNPNLKKVPIIMISARGEEGDRIDGLERGADDYLVKPFSPKELIARINAVFRRIRPAFVSDTLSYGSIKMDLSAKSVTNNDVQKHLGPIEYKILQSLLEYPSRVLSREQLIRRVWGCELNVEPRTIDVHINRLRSSLGLSRKEGTIIKTVRASGYCIKDMGDNIGELSYLSDSEIDD